MPTRCVIIYHTDKPQNTEGTLARITYEVFLVENFQLLFKIKLFSQNPVILTYLNLEKLAHFQKNGLCLAMSFFVSYTCLK